MPRGQGEWQEGAWQGQGQVSQSEAGGPGKTASHNPVALAWGVCKDSFLPTRLLRASAPCHPQPGLTVLRGQTPASPTTCNGRTP